MTELIASKYIQQFFTDYLVKQRNFSTNTVKSYRDTFKLFLRFISEKDERPLYNLTVQQLDQLSVLEFLNFLEEVRGVGIATRNVRLAALKSFFKYLAFIEPSAIEQCRQIAAISSKRNITSEVTFLTRNEYNAVLHTPNIDTWFGKRDYAILLVLIRTGMRVSELVSLNIDNIEFGRITKVNLLGKGRKERSVPLLDDVDAVLRDWIAERAATPIAPLFIGRGGFRLSRDNIERIVRKYAQMAEQNCPSIKRKRVTPHVLRHTAAMDWRRNNIDSMTIANLLGHESLQTTSVYLHADIELKKRELDRLGKIDPRYARFSPDEKLLSFLDGL